MNEHLIKELDMAEERLGVKEFLSKNVKGKNIKVGILGCEKESYHNGEWQITRNTDIETVVYQVLGKNSMKYEVAMQKALDDKIDVLISATQKHSWNDKLETLSEKLYQNGTILIDSSDNDGEEINAYPALSKYWFVCGADAGYSNYGNEVDFVLPTNFVNPNSDMSNYIPITHTSGTIPLAGKMVALLKSLYGKEFDSYSFQRYIKNNCVDLREVGKDIYTGFGELRLNYEEIKPMKIEMTIDKKEMFKNGEEYVSDVAPFIKDGRTYLPVRTLVELLGCEVDWNEELRKVTIIE